MKDQLSQRFAKTFKKFWNKLDKKRKEKAKQKKNITILRKEVQRKCSMLSNKVVNHNNRKMKKNHKCKHKQKCRIDQKSKRNSDRKVECGV
jgi:hypothetical protein